MCDIIIYRKRENKTKTEETMLMEIFLEVKFMKDVEILLIIAEMIKDFEATVWATVKACEVISAEEEEEYINVGGPQIYADSEEKVTNMLWEFNSRWLFKFKASGVCFTWEIRNHFSDNTFDINVNVYSENVSFDRMWSTVDR